MNRSIHSVGFWRGFVIGGVMLVALALIWQGLSRPTPAYAQIPDSGAQRDRMIHEMVTTNKKLTEIANLLKEIRDQSAAEAPGQKPAKPNSRRP
jgi:hypothetical protein